MDMFSPTDKNQVCETIAAALEDEKPLAIRGGGSKAGFGAPVEVDAKLSTAGLSGIISYQPDELVLTAQAGTSMAEIFAALEEADQHLAFEPPDWRGLFGSPDTEPTLGGVIASNLSGPGRLRNGAARDHLLGLEMVSGRAEVIRAGGQVVKNVTGYDLCKVLAGSFGTLGVMTELSVKTLPAPEKTRTVLIAGPSLQQGIEAMTGALQSPHDISAAAYLPEEIGMLSGVRHVSRAGTSIAALRVEGPEPSVLARCEALREMAAEFGDIEELHFHNSRKFWEEIAEIRCFRGVEGQVLWRVSVPPASAAAVVERVIDTRGAGYFLDWGGGLLWLSLPTEEDGGADMIRTAIADCGGHATLVHGPGELRSRVSVFQPDPPVLAGIK